MTPDTPGGTIPISKRANHSGAEKRVMESGRDDREPANTKPDAIHPSDTEPLETGTIEISEIDGPFDLQSTLESGQSYLWQRRDGRMYESGDRTPHGGDAWYETVVPPIDGISKNRHVVRVRQGGGIHEGHLEWESTTDAGPLLEHLLRLDDDLDAIVEAAPDLPLFEHAYEQYAGMRLVRDPPFPCLISFICSAQMRVSRIYGMQRALANEYGAVVSFEGHEYNAFPTPAQLAGATEAELRDLSVGYRAPYVQQTAAMVAEEITDGEESLLAAQSLPYESAREYLTKYVGVGTKVSDCVLLFSLGFLEAIPLDTWIRTSIDEYYPDCDRGNYLETSRALRERFGGAYAGYVQTYIFAALRAGEQID